MSFPIVIVSSFTAEPIENVLSFWMRELGVSHEVKFAPYNQIFQQLLDPMSLLRLNQGGVNILLLRFEDWIRDDKDYSQDKLSRLYDELREGIYSAAPQLKSPLLVCVCENSPRIHDEPALSALFGEFKNKLEDDLQAVSNCYLINSAELDRYSVADYYDSHRDVLGHIPFTPTAFAGIATALSRKINAIKSTPYKVIVLDCDNTLWGGVIGEDGISGIDVSEQWQVLQDFMLAQKEAGILLCLCSKNVEADVMEVLEKHQNMHLRLKDVVSWRINWSPKSGNIRSLAEELNLGLDAFIFLDDNPMECEEVRANCPSVLTLNLPKQNFSQFLNNIWAFDRIKVTTEDKLRTALYQQDIARKNLEKTFSNYQDFLDGLDLQVHIAEPVPEQIPRVAQLTQRTNQFNNTTVRRTEIDIQRLSESNLQSRMVEVKDRYGDYGLVGVIIFGLEAEALVVQSFMLSCRVLGRGVENHILKYLALLARENQLPKIQIPYIATPKNIPILNFLEQILPEGGYQSGEALLFDIPTDKAAELNIIVRSDLSVASPKQDSAKPSANSQSSGNSSIQFAQITTSLATAEQVFNYVENHKVKQHRDLSKPVVLAKTGVEKQLVDIWQNLMSVDQIGIADNYFEIGGTSLLAVQLVIDIEQSFGVSLSLSAILEYPTIELLAKRIAPQSEAELNQQPILLNNGVGQTAIFFIHDGDGEVLLYRNLALYLEDDFRVYGIKPNGNGHLPIVDTAIPEMAANYIRQIYAVQSQGPYLLAGMCAGGVIAYEVAKQLRSKGHEVMLVGLIDAADVAAEKRVGRVSSQRLSRLSESLGINADQSLVVRVSGLAKIVFKKAFNLVHYEVSSKLKKLVDYVKVSLLRQSQIRKWPISNLLFDLSVRSVYLYAEGKYHPESAFDGELVLFRATSGIKEDEPYVEVYSDPLLGWGPRSSVGVKTYDIPGGHSSMLQEPNVKHMADSIREYTKGSTV
jgi:FkbH-like protein